MFWIVLGLVDSRRIGSLHWSLLLSNVYGLVKRGSAVTYCLMHATGFCRLSTTINRHGRCDRWISRFTVDRRAWIRSNSIVCDSYLSWSFGGSNRTTVCLCFTVLNRLFLFLQRLFWANTSPLSSVLTRIQASCQRWIHVCEHAWI